MLSSAVCGEARSTHSRCSSACDEAPSSDAKSSSVWQARGSSADDTSGDDRRDEGAAALRTLLAKLAVSAEKAAVMEAFMEHDDPVNGLMEVLTELKAGTFPLPEEAPDTSNIARSKLASEQERADAALSREELLLGLLDSLKKKLDSGIRKAREELQMAKDYHHDTVAIGHADLDITQYFREMGFYEINMLPSLSDFCERRQVSDKARFKRKVWRRLRSESFRIPIATASPPRRQHRQRWSDDEEMLQITPLFQVASPSGNSPEPVAGRLPQQPQLQREQNGMGQDFLSGQEELAANLPFSQQIGGVPDLRPSDGFQGSRNVPRGWEDGQRESVAAGATGSTADVLEWRLIALEEENRMLKAELREVRAALTELLP